MTPGYHMFVLRTLITLITSFAFAQTFAQTPLWEENFSDSTAVAAKWANGGVNPGPVDWDWTQDPAIGNYEPSPFNAPTASTGFMWFNSDGNLNNVHIATLTGIGKPANTAGIQQVHIRFYSAFAVLDTAATTTQVGISTNNGASFTYYNIPVFENMVPLQFYEGWVDLAIPAADDKANVIIQFRYASQNDYWWKIDDVSLYSATPVPTFVGFQVNMAQQTIQPSGVFIEGIGPDIPLIAVGNGIYSATVPVPTNTTLFYRFKNGTQSESLPLDCAVTTPQGIRRTLRVSDESIFLEPVCFNTCTGCSLPCMSDPLAFICENFENYAIGLLSPQKDWWLPSGVGETSLLGASVVDNPVAGGSRAMAIAHDVENGSAGDRQLLLLGNRTTGSYRVSMKILTPNQKSGFFAFQQEEAPGAMRPFEIRLDSNGLAGLNIQGSNGTFEPVFTFQPGSWIDLAFEVDLNDHYIRLFADGAWVKTWQYIGNLGAVYFGAPEMNDLFYVDDLTVAQMAGPESGADLCQTAADINFIFAGKFNETAATPLFDNTSATISPFDPVPSCFGDLGTVKLNRPLWFRFQGTGGRYRIETGPCDATDYIDNGDTQMALYTGDHCEALQEIECAEDFSSVDYRAVIPELATTAGTDYFMLVDGWSQPGFFATGEFCIQATLLPEVDCIDGSAGAVTLGNNGNLCKGRSLASIISLDTAGFSLPTVGPVAGMAWIVTQSPVPPGVWPAGLMLAGTPVAPFVFKPNVSVAGLVPGTYFLTPVVIGRGIDLAPGAFTYLNEVDISGGCYFTGTSQPFTVLGDIAPIAVTFNSVPPTTANPPDGSIQSTVTGGLPPYIFVWTGPNGFLSSDQNLSGLAPGNYSVTVTDQSGCPDPVSADFIFQIVAAEEPADLQYFNLNPNPAGEFFFIDFALDKEQWAEVGIFDAVGRQIWTNTQVASGLRIQVSSNGWPGGIYWVRLKTADGLAVRKLMKY